MSYQQKVGLTSVTRQWLKTYKFFTFIFKWSFQSGYQHEVGWVLAEFYICD